jgi:hypothetical protein
MSVAKDGSSFMTPGIWGEVELLQEARKMTDKANRQPRFPEAEPFFILNTIDSFLKILFVSFFFSPEVESNYGGEKANRRFFVFLADSVTSISFFPTKIMCHIFEFLSTLLGAGRVVALPISTREPNVFVTTHSGRF